MKQVITVKAIIKQDDRVLLLRRSGGNPLYSGLYELPGGKLDFGEDPTATIQREVTEEIGVEPNPVQLYDTRSVVDANDPQLQYVILTYLAAIPEDSKLVLSPEHDKYAWKKLSEIQLKEITDTTKDILKIEDVEGITLEENNSVITENVEEKTSKNDNMIVYCDGGSRGNPGPSASGFVIKDDQERVLFEGGKYLGITTNNQAEYQAVKLALEKALEMGGRELQFRLDSLLVVNQLTGIYQIRNRDLWPIHAAIKELIKKFKKVTFTHVRREFNTEADAMVNQILDQHS